jgi:hypothetical protein
VFFSPGWPEPSFFWSGFEEEDGAFFSPGWPDLALLPDSLLCPGWPGCDGFPPDGDCDELD